MDGGCALSNIIRWKVENERSIKFLKNVWIDDIPLDKWPITTNTNQLEGSLVANLIYVNDS